MDFKKGHFLKTALLKRKWSEEMTFQSFASAVTGGGEILSTGQTPFTFLITKTFFHSRKGEAKSLELRGTFIHAPC